MSDLPGLVVIGAQKCGTTTLYEDLRQHPGLFVAEKESAGLEDHDLPRPEALERYRAQFRRAGGRVPVDISTTYSMRPRVEVVTSARAVLDHPLVVYVVRDPIDRVVSHHHHDYAMGLISDDIDLEIRRYPPLVDNSCYAMQVQPWVEAFGLENLMVIRFEDYVKDRQGHLDQITARLGLSPIVLAHPDAAHNVAAEKVLALGRWRAVSGSAAYRRLVRPLVPESLRRRLMRSVLPRAAARPPGPSSESLAFLRSRLEPEVRGLADLLGTRPWWNLAESSARNLRGS